MHCNIGEALLENIGNTSQFPAIFVAENSYVHTRSYLIHLSRSVMGDIGGEWRVPCLQPREQFAKGV